MDKWLIYGKGGHARVIADAILKINSTANIQFFDDRDCPYEDNYLREALLVIGIGNNRVRCDINERISHDLGIVIHPSAQIASDVIIGQGTVILANAVIQTGVILGKNCIVNANVTVDHDVSIGDYVSIYPGAYIGGGAKITDFSVVEPNQSIARSTVF